MGSCSIENTQMLERKREKVICIKGEEIKYSI
jgi:hypothetical protein